MSGKSFPVVQHEVDFCVVGGGMAGLVGALAAARLGAKTLLIHDRPILGGNASSEIRVHVCGADRHNGIKFMRETGILEEIRLDNLRVNPNRNFSVWDTVLYEKARFQQNLDILLNCTCRDAKMNGRRIESVTAWQLTTQTHHLVKASIFADCSGDGVLALPTGADFRMGREGRSEYGESIAPEVTDERTMGMTCLFSAKEYDTVQHFEPPAWAYRYDDENELPYGADRHKWWSLGYWWVELGGEVHSIYDTENIRDELLKTVYGLWDHIKNRGNHGADNWALDWIQFLPGKRESRRYLGGHVLTQNDIEAEGRFEDVVAYGGWSMDDHHPAGFRAARIGSPATIFHRAPSPYGIPYRTLYSRNVENLMFAGRCASASHAAMSSTRVMGTGCSQGQAMGTAAAIAVRAGKNPADVTGDVGLLQQMLLYDDAYIPWLRQEFSPLTMESALTASHGDPSPLRDGTNRPVGKDMHSWESAPGCWTAYTFDRKAHVAKATLILDSAMDRLVAMSHHQPDDQLAAVPDVMPRAFHIDGLVDGKWKRVAEVENNHQRLVRVDINREVEGIRCTLDETWGAEKSNVYAFYLE
ncbi:MAG: FAD-dependent oxidoreductase [Planctomycetes bacterium]|nr:FAD-dependent oxidoreductase [Planctomycetota bacterium]